MHFDTRLVILSLVIFYSNGQEYSDGQSYLSLIEFHRGGISTDLIFSSPHGGFLGVNITSSQGQSISLHPLPVAGCYNSTLERCVYSIQDCLKPQGETLAFRADARCIIDRSSSPTMFVFTKAIAQAFPASRRPYVILNKLTRQYLDPAEDLPRGTFLLETAIRSYSDYHRFIAIAKEAIRPSSSSGLVVEFIFHKKSQTVFLGYGFDPTRSLPTGRSLHSTISELFLRGGPNSITGNRSLSYCLRLNGFDQVIPLDQQRTPIYRFSTYSTRMHADQRTNAILFSYPIERLRTHSITAEAQRIANALEQFLIVNNIKTRSSSSSSSILSYTNPVVIVILLLIISYDSVCFFVLQKLSSI